jgi:hypothetical protein
MRGLRSTLALIVVLIGLGAYIYFVTWKQSDDKAGADQEKVFASLAPDKIEEIRVRSEAGEETTLRKQAEGWQIVAPVAARASDTDVSGITSALERVDIVRVIDEKPASLADYGLEKPRLEVEFKSAEGKPSGKLLVGQKTTTGGNLYAKRNDEPRVFLIAEYQESSLNKSTFDLRDKTVLAFKRDQLERIEVNTAGKVVELAKSGTDWKLAKPLSARADASVVEGLVGRLETAQAKSIVSEDAKPADLRKYGLDSPATSVTLHLGSARATLALGSEAEGDAVYARDVTKPVVVTIDKSVADDLKKSADDYRRKDIFEFRAYNAERIELTRNGQATAFERVKSTEEGKADTWKRVAPAAADADREKVEKLLTALADLRAASFTDSRAGTGLDAPALAVHVKFDEGKKEERVTLGKTSSGEYAATVDPGAAKLDGEHLDEIIKSLDELSK